MKYTRNADMFSLNRRWILFLYPDEGSYCYLCHRLLKFWLFVHLFSKQDWLSMMDESLDQQELEPRQPPSLRQSRQEAQNHESATNARNQGERSHRRHRQSQRLHTNLHQLYHPYHNNRGDVKMNLQSLFQEFNLSKFIVYSCLLIFSMLFALKLDGSINCSYWSVFMPLWIWKGIVVTGGVIGTIVWARNPDYRLSEASYISFKSMLISLSLQLLLLMFELLVCDKLESGRHLWTLAFIPLLFVSLLSVAITVWSLKNERAFELELFCAVNVLQFLFIALRLDNLLNWSWVVVFVPFWVLITMALIGVLYALIFAAILLRTPDIAADTRRASFHSAVSYSLVVLPLMIFLVLLSNKLDYGSFSNTSFGVSSSPFGSSPHYPSNSYPSSSYPASLPPQHPFFLFPQGGFPSVTQPPASTVAPTMMAPSSSLLSNAISSSLTSFSSTISPSTEVLAPPLPPHPSTYPASPGSSHASPPPQHHVTSPVTGQVLAAQMSYFAVCCPLYLAFVILIGLSFGSRGGNMCKYFHHRALWFVIDIDCFTTGWFGIRRDFCSFLLTICPCLREYGNISYTKQSNNLTSTTATNPNANNPTTTFSSSSSSATTSPDVEGNRRNNLEDSFHFVASRMNAMIVCQPKKSSSQLPPHISIESPDWICSLIYCTHFRYTIVKLYTCCLFTDTLIDQLDHDFMPKMAHV